LSKDLATGELTILNKAGQRVALSSIGSGAKAQLIHSAALTMKTQPSASFCQERMWVSAFSLLEERARTFNSIADAMNETLEKGRAMLKANPSLRYKAAPGRLCLRRSHSSPIWS
jgi:hypothetical protein